MENSSANRPNLAGAGQAGESLIVGWYDYQEEVFTLANGTLVKGALRTQMQVLGAQAFSSKKKIFSSTRPFIEYRGQCATNRGFTAWSKPFMRFNNDQLNARQAILHSLRKQLELGTLNVNF